jgi:hypothetical protein
MTITIMTIMTITTVVTAIAEHRRRDVQPLDLSLEETAGLYNT